MAYDERLADRVRAILGRRVAVEARKMFGGLAFMVNGKMCVGVSKDDLMARIDPDGQEAALRRAGCRPMDFTGKPMRGFVFVGRKGTGTDEELRAWIELALAFNSKAKATRKRK